MSENSPIEWTDHTFNIAWGCEKVSPGCAHCYADSVSKRYGHAGNWGKDAPRRTFGEKHWRDPLAWNRKAEKEGVVRRVFCSSMCDVFEEHPTIDAEREKLWPLIRETPWLDWQLLTKRPERIAANLPSDWGEGYGNVWLGTSVENDRFVHRAEILRDIPARVRFISAEPLLNHVYLEDVFEEGYESNGPAGWVTLPSPIHWVIVGGESGPRARPMAIEWVRSLRNQCDAYGVAFFLKQLGGFPNKRGHDEALLDGVRHVAMPRKAVEVAA